MILKANVKKKCWYLISIYSMYSVEKDLFSKNFKYTYTHNIVIRQDWSNHHIHNITMVQRSFQIQNGESNDACKRELVNIMHNNNIRRLV